MSDGLLRLHIKKKRKKEKDKGIKREGHGFRQN